jgi:hypothetical protein
MSVTYGLAPRAPFPSTSSPSGYILACNEEDGIRAQQTKKRSAEGDMTEARETEMVARMASATTADNTGGFGSGTTRIVV